MDTLAHVEAFHICQVVFLQIHCYCLHACVCMSACLQCKQSFIKTFSVGVGKMMSTESCSPRETWAYTPPGNLHAIKLLLGAQKCWKLATKLLSIFFQFQSSGGGGGGGVGGWKFQTLPPPPPG